MRRGRADAGRLGGREYVEANGQVEVVDGLQEAVEEGFAAFQVPRLQLTVQQVAHTQALGLVEQRRGVAQAADAQAAVGERPVAGLAEFGDLAERRAGAGPFGVAQVEMRVEIEDTDARQALMPTQVAGEAGEAGVGDFVAAAQSDHPVAAREQVGDALRVAFLGGFQIVAGDDVAGVVDRLLAVPGQVGQRATQGWRSVARALATLVAAHAFVAGEPEQHAGRFGVVCVGTHPLVPAPRVGAFLAIDPALPEAHVGGGVHRNSCRSVQPRGKSRGGVEGPLPQAFAARLGAQGGAIRLRAPCRRWRLSSSGTLMPQTPSSISPWLTA